MKGNRILFIDHAIPCSVAQKIKAKELILRWCMWDECHVLENRLFADRIDVINGGGAGGGEVCGNIFPG